MDVLVLVGSLRADSLNARLASAAARHLPAGTRVETWDGLADLPPYSEDLDAADAPEPVADLRDAIARADVLLIATPEYNGSVPGVLKNALDWASRPRGASALAGKPAAVVAASASPRGALWARQDLVRILKVAGARPVERTVGLGGAAQALRDGTLADPAVDRELAVLVGELTGSRLLAA